jgi:hypothetical protein
MIFLALYSADLVDIGLHFVGHLEHYEEYAIQGPERR